jgi:hypothetical protein
MGQPFGQYFTVAMHVKLSLAREHSMQLECAHICQHCKPDTAIDWGLMVHAVDLAEPRFWAVFGQVG